MTITKEGREVDRLVKVASPVAKRAEIQPHVMEGGIMKTRPVEAIEVNPGEPTVLKPGGLLIMLMGSKAPLMEGEIFSLTLTFVKAGPVDIRVEVQKAGAMEPGHDRGEGHAAF